MRSLIVASIAALAAAVYDGCSETILIANTVTPTLNAQWLKLVVNDTAPSGAKTWAMICGDGTTVRLAGQVRYYNKLHYGIEVPAYQVQTLVNNEDLSGDDCKVATFDDKGCATRVYLFQIPKDTAFVAHRVKQKATICPAPTSSEASVTISPDLKTAVIEAEDAISPHAQKGTAVCLLGPVVVQFNSGWRLKNSNAFKVVVPNWAYDLLLTVANQIPDEPVEDNFAHLPCFFLALAKNGCVSALLDEFTIGGGPEDLEPMSVENEKFEKLKHW